MMSLLLKARKLSLAVSNPHILTCRSRYLFILSHMRSRSTVLSHVLGSHPEIIGYSELHRCYTSRFDLVKMRMELCLDGERVEAKRDLTNKFWLDKILHNEIVLSQALLEHAQPKVVILLREPEPTLKSIMQMGHRTGVSWYQDPVQAGDYYCKRLERLSAYGRAMAGKFFYLPSDDLVEHTDEVLTQLADWLGLQSPLLSRYEQFRNTGRRHFGDSSENIHSGVIKKTQSHSALSIPDAVLQQATSCYRRCQSQLLRQASSNDPVPRIA